MWLEAVRVEGWEGRRRHMAIPKQRPVEERAQALELGPGLNNLSVLLVLQPQFPHQQNGDDTLRFVEYYVGSCKGGYTCFCHLIGNQQNCTLVPFHTHFLYMKEFSRVGIFNKWGTERVKMGIY